MTYRNQYDKIMYVNDYKYWDLFIFITIKFSVIGVQMIFKIFSIIMLRKEGSDIILLAIN